VQHGFAVTARGRVARFAPWKLYLLSAFLNIFVAGIHLGQERWGHLAWWLGISAAMLACAHFDARTRRRQADLPGDP